MITRKDVARLIISTFSAISLTNCSSGSSSDAAAVTYYSSGGICYQSGTLTPVASTNCASGAYIQEGNNCISSVGAPVAATYCSSTASGTGYAYSNGVCYVSGTSSIVPTSLCTGSTYGSGGYGYGAARCYGYYYYSNGYPVYCAGSNCSGAVLYSQNGTIVQCL